MSNDLITYFIDTKKPTIKMTYSLAEEDYKLVKGIFVEHGFMQYFPGYSIRLLADSLRKQGITTFMDRVKSPALASPAALSVIARMAWDNTLLINTTNGVGQTKLTNDSNEKR